VSLVVLSTSRRLNPGISQRGNDFGRVWGTLVEKPILSPEIDKAIQKIIFAKLDDIFVSSRQVANEADFGSSFVLLLLTNVPPLIEMVCLSPATARLTDDMLHEGQLFVLFVYFFLFFFIFFYFFYFFYFFFIFFYFFYFFGEI
jgi:hypothetical protein